MQTLQKTFVPSKKVTRLKYNVLGYQERTHIELTYYNGTMEMTFYINGYYRAEKTSSAVISKEDWVRIQTIVSNLDCVEILSFS